VTVATTTFNPLDPQLAVDPFPLYRAERAAGPVLYNESLNAYFVWGHEEARTVLRQPDGEHRYVEFQRFRLPDRLDPEQQPYVQAVREFPTAKCGEDHRRVRAAYARHFTPRRAESLRGYATATVAHLIDAFEGRGEAELMEEFSAPLMFQTISRLLGISDPDAARIAEHLRYVKLAFQFVPLTAEQLQVLNASFDGLNQVFTEIVAARRSNRGEDLLSMLIGDADEGKLSEAELVAASWGLYVAGRDTTASFIGAALLRLLEHPDQFERLCADPARVPDAVEELLRYQPPVPVVHRILPRPLELGGHTIPPDTPIVVYLASANRDERWCPRGDGMDVGDDPRSDGLTFSDGSHKCPGRHFARMKAAVALEALITRLPRPRLGEAVEWNTEDFPIISPGRLVLRWG
jgi:pimeloyl-[acyl-carrier protein] synthase